MITSYIQRATLKFISFWDTVHFLQLRGSFERWGCAAVVLGEVNFLKDCFRVYFEEKGGKGRKNTEEVAQYNAALTPKRKWVKE